MSLDLRLDEDELSSCVGCGLCLPHCPTFRATGEEGLSPRGRIDAMRAVIRDRIKGDGGKIGTALQRGLEQVIEKYR